MDAPKILGKAQSIERRLNGKVLPFIGLHAMLLSLLFLLSDGEPPLQQFFESDAGPAWALLFISLLLFTIYLGAVWYFSTLTLAGGLAAPVLVGMIAVSMLMPEGLLQVAVPILLYLVFVLMSVLKRVPSQEAQMVYLYLPAVFLGAMDLKLGAQLSAAFLLYLPAIYAQFVRNKVYSKVPLGVSMLVYLAVIVDRNEDSHLLITLLIALSLVLFIGYSVFMNKDKGSSQKHFLVDIIVVGLWGILLAVGGVDDTWVYLQQCGLGVLFYQGAKFVWYHYKRSSGDGYLAARDAALGWVLLGVLAVSYNLVTDLLSGLEGDRAYYLAGLLLLMPFILVFKKAHAPLLASITRVGLVAVLVSGVWTTQIYFSDTYDNLQLQQHEANGENSRPDGFPGGPSAELPPTSSEGSAEVEVLKSEYALMWRKIIRSEWLLLGLLIVGGYAGTLRVVAGYKIPWWRGMVNPRHMVLARQFGRILLKNAKSIPVFGVVIGLIGKALAWIQFVSGHGAGEFSRNLLILTVHICGVAFTMLTFRHLTECCVDSMWVVLKPMDLFTITTWCVWGVVLYIYGGIAKHAPARLYAVAFVFTPVIGVANWEGMDNSLFAETLLLAGLTFFLFGLLRKPETSVPSRSTTAH